MRDVGYSYEVSGPNMHSSSSSEPLARNTRVLVVDDNSRIVGYVRTNEYANPSFDGIVLTYDEQGLRNGELNRNGWRLITTPSL